MILLDTSAWVYLFRAGGPDRLPSSVRPDEVVLCLPVVQEVLQGIRDDLAAERAAEALDRFPCVEDPLRRAVFQHAIVLYRQARRAGLTIRSGVDCLVAACALRNGLEVVHRDRDFEALARISSLRQRALEG